MFGALVADAVFLSLWFVGVWPNLQDGSGFYGGGQEWTNPPIGFSPNPIRSAPLLWQILSQRLKPEFHSR